MLSKSVLGLVAAAALATTAAQAAPTIVNLNASSTNPNAGHNSGTYAYNPVTLTLSAGTYNVKVVGIAGGGMYDAYSLATPPTGTYTDAQWSVSLNGTTAAYTQENLGRASTAAAAAAVYSAAPGYTFSLASTQAVSFYVDDSAYPYFGDNTGGLSLGVSAVPEPATMALLLAGVAGAVAVRRRSKGLRTA